LSGVLRRNQSWQYEPMLDEVGGESVGELLTLAYRPPSKWPFADEPEARRVLDWLTQYNRGATDLTPLGNGDCYDPGKLRDVRSSYCSMELDWALYAARLGDSRTGGLCANYPTGELVDVSEDKYKQVCDQVSREIGQLADVKGDMGQLRALIADGAGSALTTYLAILDMTNKVKAAVEANNKPKHNVTAEAFGIAATSLELISLFIPETEAFEGVLQAAEFFAPTLSLTGEITSLVEGDEQGEAAVHAPVTLDAGELATEMDNRLKAAGAAFDHAWDMVISDPEKLNTAHENFTLDPKNRNNDPECKQPGKTCGIWRGMARKLSGQDAQAAMQNGVRHWAAGKFMAATYDVWLVPSGYVFQDGKWWDVDVQSFNDVTTSDLPTIGCYVSQRQNDFHPFRSPAPPPDAAYYFRDKWGLTRPRDGTFANIRGNNVWLFVQSSDVWDGDAAKNYPPQSLLSQLYSPPKLSAVGGGYGWKRPWLYTEDWSFLIHPPRKEFRSGYLGCGWFHN